MHREETGYVLMLIGPSPVDRVGDGPIIIMGFSLLSASEFLQTEKWRCAKQ